MIMDVPVIYIYNNYWVLSIYDWNTNHFLSVGKRLVVQ